MPGGPAGSIFAARAGGHAGSECEMRLADMRDPAGKVCLAGGDHLHFGVMVGGIPVTPIEWWDDHWIKDNIMRKLDLAEDS